MNQLNDIIVEGNLVKEPDFVENAGGTGLNVSNFPIAVNRKVRTSSGETVDEVSYFDIEAWGSNSDLMKKWGQKGRPLRIVGRLKQDIWEDNGVKKSRVKIIAEHIETKLWSRDVKKTSAQNKKKSKDDDYGRGM